MNAAMPAVANACSWCVLTAPSLLLTASRILTAVLDTIVLSLDMLNHAEPLRACQSADGPELGVCAQQRGGDLGRDQHVLRVSGVPVPAAGQGAAAGAHVGPADWQHAAAALASAACCHPGAPRSLRGSFCLTLRDWPCAAGVPELSGGDFAVADTVCAILVLSALFLLVLHGPTMRGACLGVIAGLGCNSVC